MRRGDSNSGASFSAAPETRYPLPKGIPQTLAVVVRIICNAD